MPGIAPQDEARIAEDKQQWLEANQMYGNWPKNKIVAWLNAQDDQEYKEDMRRRLNLIRTRRSEK